jgi:hypothetical protein
LEGRAGKPIKRDVKPVSLFPFPRSLHWVAPPLCFVMSLAEIEKAVDELSPKELTKLAAYITRRDKLAWDQEIEEDFSPGGKHEKTLEKIDAEIDSGACG